MWEFFLGVTPVRPSLHLGAARHRQVRAGPAVRGRGGTVLQPGIDLLEAARDFPKKGPILIITYGVCNHFRTRRDHAILLPKGRHLAFPATGKVFRLS